uniref:Uncharacterized protein n=1 Tax=Tanacetum cinerariifolium TaxID=118510 RepID=A0A699R8L2_TANCI|nr:hypothetical protein [Tanacetum cinerariifolium]
MMLSIPMTFLSANSTEYLVSTVGPSKVLWIRGSHNLRDFNSRKGSGFSLSAKGMVFLYAKVEEKLLSYDAYECGFT